ncbi:MAG: glycosyltransferase [Pseudohongiellaceae bacterium]
MSASLLISILIRTKNRKQLLQQAVASVLQQTHTQIEIIIVNDGGDDYAVDFSASVLHTNNKVVWLNNTATQGRSAAANIALQYAQGDYCLFLDDDDWLDPHHLSNLLYAVQQQPDCLLAYSAIRTFDESTGLTAETFQHPFDAVRLLIENYIPIHAVLFARKLITLNCRFDTSLDRYEDWDFWLQCLQHSDFLFVPIFTATYRVSAQSGFGNKDNPDQLAYRLAVYRKWLPRLNSEQLLAVIDRSRLYPQLAVFKQELTLLKVELNDQTHYLNLLQKQELEFIAELQRRADHMAELAAGIQQSELQLQQSELQIQAMAQEILDVANTLQQSQSKLQLELATVSALKSELNVIFNSRSWKLTKPLRLLTKVRYLLQVEGFSGVARRVYLKLSKRKPVLPAVAVTPPPSPHVFHPLVFTVHEKPLISIVIPVYNKVEYSFHCLKTLLANSADQTYEVIVVDDCSQDETAKMLASIKGIRVIRNKTNSGFIYSCNTGAQAARGEFLLLFNNDTEPQLQWLSALVNTFRDMPDAGMVGAKLLYPDGRLQEAGGIVWQDGSAWNYGRDDDPNRPEYSWCRQVDYCSGACLMLSSADFAALGMFDTLYTPAYYEDTDLAFKVRAAGKKVYYQPLARVIHFEGVSCGTDATGGIKEYQRTNHHKFFARWQTTLQSHRPNARLPNLEKERNISKRVLVVDARVLMPDHDSGSLRMFNLLKIFHNLGYKVSFIPDNLHYHEKYTPILQSLGVECFYRPYLNNVQEHLQHNGNQYQVVVLSRADYAEKYIDAVVTYCPQAQILFDTVDLHFLRERRLAELNNDSAQAAAAELRKVQELGIARKAHQTLVVSPVEIELFRREAPDVKVALLSNIHASAGRGADFANRNNILFIGSFEHPPNVDAMHWFIDEIFPVLHQLKPALKLLIVGGGAPKNLLAKASKNIEFAGFVADIAPLFNSARLSIAPLRYGAGVKGKINSSMAFGVPVVASTIAAEGMGLEDGKDVLIADDPAEFAQLISRAYDDEQLWYALSNAGLENIERCFSFTVATQQLRKILENS